MTPEYWFKIYFFIYNVKTELKSHPSLPRVTYIITKYRNRLNYAILLITINPTSHRSNLNYSSLLAEFIRQLQVILILLPGENTIIWKTNLDGLQGRDNLIQFNII